MIVALSLLAIGCYAKQLTGWVYDIKTNELLIGAVIELEGTNKKAVTDIDGRFTLDNIPDGTYNLLASYIGYEQKTVAGVRISSDQHVDSMRIGLVSKDQALGGVTVTGIMRRNTEEAAIQQVKSSASVMNNVSSQEITKTQDSNAGEVIRRVPGVSLIEDKFVMVRGLSQRYNNVWMNGGAVASSEADARAFSFDIIPSGQIDNLSIVKSPLAEYPADYSGGFILISTKEIPTNNSGEFQIGGNWNSRSAFRNFSLNRRSTDWHPRDITPLGDLKLSGSVGRNQNIAGHKLGIIATLNFTDEYRTYEQMQNNLFGVYDVTNDRSNYLRQSTDNQFNHNSRWGAMINLTLLSRNGGHKFQFKNIFNHLTNNRYTAREGISAQANKERSAEYYYRSRTTYNGQITGKHSFFRDELDWSVGYAYANRRLPDRRRYLTDDALESGVYALSTGNDISKEWTKLDEHIFSANANDRHQLHFGNWEPSLKVGVYGEYRTREYTTNEYFYNWNAAGNTLPTGFRHMDMADLLSDESNYGPDKLYLIEQLAWRNNYKGRNMLEAGYVTAVLPFGKLNIYAGLRFEHNDMELISNTRDNERSEMSRHYRSNDLFPSLNATYKFDERNQLRFSYGRSVNRPEFREVSPSVYYDFDLASNVQGNTELASCYIQNLDLRYELYPSRGEMISFAAFYKYFDSPIEWTYTVAGGTDLVYSYKNAKSARSYGLELDIRKDLAFIGLRNFSWSFNGSLIKSEVLFAKDSREKDRPMQGQSPYLVNTGVFYNNERLALQMSLLYNRIGKRIVGVGRSMGNSDESSNNRVPDSYEMPRDVLDFSASKRFGRHWEMKFSVRDLFAGSVRYKQFADVEYSDGSTRTVEQITRNYRPGRNVGLAVTYRF